MRFRGWIAVWIVTGCFSPHAGPDGPPPDGVAPPSDAGPRADAAPPDAVQPPPDALPLDGCTMRSCYLATFLFCADLPEADRETAIETCRAWSGSGVLAQPQSAIEVNCLGNELSDPQRAWVGLKQSTGATSVGAGWRWETSGAPFAGTWNESEPDDGEAAKPFSEDVGSGVEDCAVLLQSAGGPVFADVPCGSTQLVACELRSAPL